jgi:hypothetical protein
MFWSRRLSTRKTILPALIACIAVSVLLLTVKGHSSKKVTSPVLTPQVKKDQKLEIETVTITSEGFEPQQLERPAGPFILSVVNRSGVDALNVRIETEQHGRFREKSLPQLTPYWRERIDPYPGRYIITEENHPEWTLTLIIK